MKVEKSAADADLAKLKALAGEILAAETPEPSMFDQLAALATTLAAGCREIARCALLQRIVDTAPTVFTTAAEDFRIRLENTPQEELSSLAALLDEATAVRRAFAEADTALMAARERGDYAAVAPLALEADAKKNAFAVASAQFANRVGLGDGLLPDLMPGDAVSPPAPAAAMPVAAEPAGEAAPEADAARVEQAAEEEPLELNSPVASPAERRRVRDLIRHMRPAAEEPAAAP